MENNILDKTKAWIPYAILIFIIILPWFLKSGYLFFTDMSAGPHIIVPKFFASGFFYYHFIAKVLSYTLPIDLIQKLFFTVILGVVLWGGYRVARSLTQNKTLLFLGSAFALFNPFVYDRLMYGQVGVMLGYGFFLAFFGYLLSFYLVNKLRKQFFFSSVFAGLTVLFSPHFLFFIGLSYFVFGFLIFMKNWKDKRELWKIAKYFVLCVIIIGAINFNWLLGTFFSNATFSGSVEEITKQDLEAFKTVGGTDLGVIENVFLMSGFWGTEQFRYEPLQNIKGNWGRSFYFLLPLIILGLIYNFKEKRGLTIGLILIYFAAFILALGIALPITSKITLWLFNNVPFYKGLREPQKWVAVLAAVYEVLLVCGLNQLFKRNIVIKNKGLLTVLLTFVILLQAPLMVWGGAGQIKSVNYPWDWYEVNEFIAKETNCKTKSLFLPWHSYMNFKWIGKIVANPAARFFECSVIYGQNMEFGGIFGHSIDPDEREVEKWVFNVGRTNLLEENKLNIDYIILAKEVDWQNYLWLNNHPNVEFIKETENLRVYKIHPVK